MQCGLKLELTPRVHVVSIQHVTTGASCPADNPIIFVCQDPHPNVRVRRVESGLDVSPIDIMCKTKIEQKLKKKSPIDSFGVPT